MINCIVHMSTCYFCHNISIILGNSGGGVTWFGICRELHFVCALCSLVMRVKNWYGEGERGGGDKGNGKQTLGIHTDCEECGHDVAVDSCFWVWDESLSLLYDMAALIFPSRWTIRARVTSKPPIRTWSNSRGEGKVLSVNLLDESVSPLHHRVL